MFGTLHFKDIKPVILFFLLKDHKKNLITLTIAFAIIAVHYYSSMLVNKRLDVVFNCVNKKHKMFAY